MGTVIFLTFNSWNKPEKCHTNWKNCKFYVWKLPVGIADCSTAKRIGKIYNHFIEHTCAYARWAHMHRFLSVCPMSLDQNSLDQNPRLENNSYLRKYRSASITCCMVHLQAIASRLPDTPMMVYGTGRWAHFNVKLHF